MREFVRLVIGNIGRRLIEWTSRTREAQGEQFVQAIADEWVRRRAS